MAVAGAARTLNHHAAVGQKAYGHQTWFPTDLHAMTVLFWILFVLDVLLCLLAIVGKGFRDDFGASSINTWFTVLLFAGIIGALICKLLGRHAWALACAALPVLVMLVWYFVDTRVKH